MNLFALFLCIQAAGTCQIQGASPRAVAGGVMTLNSLAECQQYAKRVSGLITPPTDGRFLIPPGGMWFECRSKHVDTRRRALSLVSRFAAARRPGCSSK